jgi:hypothetical protein
MTSVRFNGSYSIPKQMDGRCFKGYGHLDYSCPGIWPPPVLRETDHGSGSAGKIKVACIASWDLHDGVRELSQQPAPMCLQVEADMVERLVKWGQGPEGVQASGGISAGECRGAGGCRTGFGGFGRAMIPRLAAIAVVDW